MLSRGRSTPGVPAIFPARDVTIASGDGVSLAATYRPGSRPGGPAILLLHGVDASRQAVAGNAAWLAGQGFATLAIDFRGHGQSTRRQRTFGWTEANDAWAAFAWLKREQRDAPIGVIGISMGGAASLIGPRGPLPADALVLQAVYPDIRRAIHNRLASRLGGPAAALGEPLLSYQTVLRIGIDPAEISPATAIRRFPRPILVVGGRYDRATPLRDTLRLAAAGRQTAVWIVPSGDHAAISALATAAYRRRLFAFFRAGLTR